MAYVIMEKSMDIKKLNQKKAKELAAYIVKYTDFSFAQLHGFLAAIISGPNVMMPSKCFQVIGINDIEFKSEEEAKHRIGDLMSLYNDIAHQLHDLTYKPFISFKPIKTLKTADSDDIFKAY